MGRHSKPEDSPTPDAAEPQSESRHAAQDSEVTDAHCAEAAAAARVVTGS